MSMGHFFGLKPQDQTTLGSSAKRNTSRSMIALTMPATIISQRQRGTRKSGPQPVSSERNGKHPHKYKQQVLRHQERAQGAAGKGCPLGPRSPHMKDEEKALGGRSSFRSSITLTRLRLRVKTQGSWLELASVAGQDWRCPLCPRAPQGQPR